MPRRDFNWLLFIFCCGIFYLPFYLVKRHQCPICGGQQFESARPTD